MPEAAGAESLDQMISQALRTLATVRSTGVTADGPPLQGEGRAAGGKVSATVSAGGRLTALSVDPRVMREGSEAMCAEIITAVNAAVDELRAKAEERAAAVTAGSEEISATLLGLQQESVRQMERFTQSLNDVVARFERRT